MSGAVNVKPMVTDVFVRGAVNGWNISVMSTIPTVLMAFVIIKILKHSGLLDIIGQVFSPVMAVFGLPGEAATVLIGAWMSMGGGVGVAVSLFDHNILTGAHLGILAPSIFLMGSQVQYMGRCLGVIGIQGRDMLTIMAIPVIVAFFMMFVMRLIVMGA